MRLTVSENTLKNQLATLMAGAAIAAAPGQTTLFKPPRWSGIQAETPLFRADMPHPQSKIAPPCATAIAT
ncbi:MAG: hypothetical protein AAF722_22030 [Cyanobacteria bacterium P01_C01_bin.70]